MISNKYIVIKILVVLYLTFGGGYSLFSQEKDKEEKIDRKIKEKIDEKWAEEKREKSKISYWKLSKKGNKKQGIFNVYYLEGDYYFEIDNSLFGKDFLIVSKVSQVPYAINGHGLNKGMSFETKLIRFYYDKDLKKVWVKTINPRVQSPDSDYITNSVKDNFIASIIEQFEVQATSKRSKSVVIKVNKVFNGREKSFFDLLNSIGLGGSVKTKLSKIEKVKTFPKNVVVKSLISTSVREGKGAALPLSIGVTTNIVLLPEDVMKPRFEDKRIGYFSTPMDYYNDEQHEVEHRRLITRWRLEPKREDIEKYKKGELVTPKKQIVYYISPSTPKKWVPYIKKGVLDWNKTFEKAGFKDAVVVKEVSKYDMDFDVDDIRYSTIVYTASERQNAMGPSIFDPRSGEILEADIIWWHNLMKGLHSWLRVQTGVINDNSRKNRFSDEHMGEAIRFVSSHEVGHTFGLKHNMGASFSYPVDSLRSATFTKKVGGTAPSIMDYARYNYVAQPEDKVTELNPKIGVYDEYAIGWGYRWMEGKTPYDDLPKLNDLIRKHENDPLYFYGEQQQNIIDPRSQSEDLGNDAIKASTYGLMNLKKMVPKIIEWTHEEGKSYYRASRLYKDIINQWELYNNHVMANIGGIYINNTVFGDGKETYCPVPAKIQKEALKYLIDNTITPQKWLFMPKDISKIFAVRDAPDGEHYYSPISMIRVYQSATFYKLLDTDRLLRIAESNVLNKKSETFTQVELFDELYNTIFAKTIEKESLDIYDRITQKNYVDALIISRNALLKKILKKGLLDEEKSFDKVYFSYMPRVSDVGSKKYGQLVKILKLLEKRQKKGDKATREHYADLISRIRYNLK